MPQGDMPRVSAEYLNKRVVGAVEAMDERITRNLRAVMASGYLPFTTPVTPAEEREFLATDEAIQQGLEMSQSPETEVRAQGIDQLRSAIDVTSADREENEEESPI